MPKIRCKPQVFGWVYSWPSGARRQIGHISRKVLRISSESIRNPASISPGNLRGDLYEYVMRIDLAVAAVTAVATAALNVGVVELYGVVPCPADRKFPLKLSARRCGSTDGTEGFAISLPESISINWISTCDESAGKLPEP